MKDFAKKHPVNKSKSNKGTATLRARRELNQPLKIKHFFIVAGMAAILFISSQFLLQTDVLIEMQDMESNGSDPIISTISCDWAELFLGSDGNSSTNLFGSISKIHALGKVKLNQPLRESSADELKWSEESGQVNLHGNAKVSHQKWGVALGEHIILLEEDGRAEVIGGNQGRSKLFLPALNKTNPTK